jgi:hypothetical protein
MLHVLYQNLLLKKKEYEAIQKIQYKPEIKCNDVKCEKDYCIQGCWKYHCFGCGRGILHENICEYHDCFYSVTIQNNLENLYNRNQEVEGVIVSLKAGLFQTFCKNDLLVILKLIKKEDPSMTISGCIVDYRKNV